MTKKEIENAKKSKNIKDCLKCRKLFMCKLKQDGSAPCVFFEERKKQ